MGLIVFFLLFILPLIVFPFGVSVFETPKILIAEMSIQLSVVLWLWRTKLKFREIIKKQRLWALLAVFTLSLINPNFLGNIFRLQGVFLLWHFLIFAALLHLAKPTLPYPGFSVITIVILLISAILVSPNESGRAIGLVGEPNALAAAAVFLWVFALGLKNLPVKFLAYMIALMIIMFSGSRSSLTAFIIQSLFLILAARASMATALIIAVLLIIISWGLPFVDNGGPFQNRVTIWQTAVVAGLSRPFVGWGFGNTEQALATTAVSLKNNLRYEFVDSSHNLFLDWFVQGGVAGLGLLCVLIFGSLKSMAVKKDYQSLAQLLGLLTVLSFNPASIVTLVAFWWLIGN